jgi:hypothetical protein
MMIINTILFLLLIIITVYIVVYIIYPGSVNTDLVKSLTLINTQKSILTSDITQTTLLSGAGSTVMGFFKLNDGDRTIKYQDGYTSLLQIANNWYLEISPSPHEKHSAARLRIQTSDGGTIKQEIIELPQIPKQKWIFIAILRDGRR